MSKDQYKRWQAHGFGAFEHYAWQLSAYMHALGDETALYVVKDRNLGAREVSVQHLPPKSLADVKARALAIWSAAHRDMPPCDPQRYMCSMWFLHDEGAEEQDTRQAVGRHDQAIINELCREYDELGVKERAARALREKLRDQIKAAVGDLGRFSTGAYNVTVTKRKSTSYRWKDMVADGVVDEETLERYRNPAYEMLRVSQGERG